tara:strand:- start:159 stop:989 length:831 start_codon:yes stop_codon:yes gene_type:complete
MKIRAFTFVFLVCSVVFSQVKTPPLSPKSELTQVVGFTEMKIEYSRPSMRGRKIMGNLVNYDDIWRTGANSNTKITVSDDVMFGKNNLPAGTYSILTRPGKKIWEVFFYTEDWSLPKVWDQEKIALKLEIPVKSMNQVETFSIWIGDISTDSASLNLAWENSRIEIPFSVSTDETTIASIKETMIGKPGHRDYYSAASYYLTTGRDLKQAEKWIIEAVKEKEYYFYYRTKAEIHAGLNKFKLAVEAANKSIELAEKRGTKNLISLNKRSIEEWSGR